MKKLSVIFVALAFPLVALAQTIGTYTVSFTRPANATEYAAGDMVRTATAKVMPIRIPNTKLASYMGEIESAVAVADTMGPAYFTLYLLSDTAGTTVGLPADNAAFRSTAAISKKILGKVSFSCASADSGSAIDVKTFDPIPFNVYGLNKALYGMVVADSAFTPKNGGEFTIRLGIKYYK